ncbi:hypothetical protein WJX72_008425 [[Myrmecia] bisecta]|uniref:NFACT RNA-binding domain-containing protein n=1 Tax=[Myrmecia] bisecta TaxID=41462 RepID=A0AAW1Q7M8_9CHLO
MVFYFMPRGHGPARDDFLIYMGKDKYENEDLIKYGLPHDVWFHVDDLSSAHVYLRLKQDTSVEDIPADTLEDCVQLVKANSIQGNKQAVDVVYTPCTNLKKAASMDVGQVGFYDDKKVKKVAVPKRINDIVNRLNRSKEELYPDLAADKEAFEREVRAQRKSVIQAVKKAEKAQRDKAKEEEDRRSYKHIMQDDSMVSRSDIKEKYKSPADYEEDFM